MKNFWERKCKEEASIKSLKSKKLIVDDLNENVHENSLDTDTSEEWKENEFKDKKGTQFNMDALYSILLIGFLISGFGLFILNHSTDLTSMWTMVYNHWIKQDVYYHVRETQEAFVNMSTLVQDLMYQHETLFNLFMVCRKGFILFMNQYLFYLNSL